LSNNAAGNRGGRGSSEGIGSDSVRLVESSGGSGGLSVGESNRENVVSVTLLGGNGELAKEVVNGDTSV